MKASSSVICIVFQKFRVRGHAKSLTPGERQREIERGRERERE
jgi:hypothetical protein